MTCAPCFSRSVVHSTFTSLDSMSRLGIIILVLTNGFVSSSHAFASLKLNHGTTAMRNIVNDQGDESLGRFHSKLALRPVLGNKDKNHFPRSLVSGIKMSHIHQQHSLTTLKMLSDFLGDDSDTPFHPATQHCEYTRRPIIAGNWKLNPTTLAEAVTLLKLLAANFINHDRASGNAAQSSSPSHEGLDVVIFPPFPFLSTAIQLLDGTGIKVGAQNVGLQSKGAFTGEVSPSMLASLGCEFVMLGHSERRILFKETDDDINMKIKLCLAEGKTNASGRLNVILCVGETEEEFNNDLLVSVVDLQVKKALRNVSIDDLDRLVIAYEPVWAIGTGKVATPEQAQKAHVAIRKTLSSMYGNDIAYRMRIQYGGSVTPDSIQTLMMMPDVDGALVGGASLSAESFSRIVDGGLTSPSNNLFTSLQPKEFMARECISCKNVLGESPVWSTRDKALYWISAPEQECWVWNLKDAPYRRLFRTQLGCVVLKKGLHGSIVLGGESALLSTIMTTSSLSSSSSSSTPVSLYPMADYGSNPTVLSARPEQMENTRPNDGRVDRQGRFVFGMYNNYHRSGASEGENNAGIYRLNSKLEMEQLLDYKYRVSNCICFPSDGKTMYFCDTPTRKVYAFDYPEEDGGRLTNRRLIWTMPPNVPGGPDGAQVDSVGGLWIALSGAGRVVRINPTTGQVDFIIHLPVKSPTSCTFGGLNLDELFITSRGPDGGGLYRVKMPYGIKGLPEPEFEVDENEAKKRSWFL